MGRWPRAPGSCVWTAHEITLATTRARLVPLGLAEAAAAAICAAGPAGAREPHSSMTDFRSWTAAALPADQPSAAHGARRSAIEQPRQAPVDSSRAPAPRRPDAAPTTKIVVLGDSMADWLAYGLEDAFAETPEIGVLRKHRTNSGLIRFETRGESYDWPHEAREMLNAEKPEFVVMMIGLPTGAASARRSGRSRRGRPRARSSAPAQPASRRQRRAQPPAPAGRAPAASRSGEAADAEASPPSPAQDAAPDRSSRTSRARERDRRTGVHEFRSEKWGELYSRRIDEMIGVLKSAGVPVFWVGLPAVRGVARDVGMVYLNDLYRGRAEKAGIIYVDVWDGFVDEAGNFNTAGPGLRGPDAAPARRRRRAFHPRRRAQARPLRRTRNPPRHAGARDAGRDAAAAGARAGREGAAGRRRARRRRVRSRAR